MAKQTLPLQPPASAILFWISAFAASVSPIVGGGGVETVVAVEIAMSARSVMPISFIVGLVDLGSRWNVVEEMKTKTVDMGVGWSVWGLFAGRPSDPSIIYTSNVIQGCHPILLPSPDLLNIVTVPNFDNI